MEDKRKMGDYLKKYNIKYANVQKKKRQMEAHL